MEGDVGRFTDVYINELFQQVVEDDDPLHSEKYYLLSRAIEGRSTLNLNQTFRSSSVKDKRKALVVMFRLVHSSSIETLLLQGNNIDDNFWEDGLRDVNKIGITQFPNIKKLDLAVNKIKDIGRVLSLEGLFQIGIFPGLTSLSLSWNRIDTNSLASCLTMLPSLEVLHLRCICLFSKLDDASISLAWGKFTVNLQEIDLSDNPLNTKTIAALFGTEWSHLRGLMLSGTSMTVHGCVLLAEAIQIDRLKALESVDLSGIYISNIEQPLHLRMRNPQTQDLGLSSLVISFKATHLPRLREIRLRNAGVGDATVSKIAEAITAGDLQFLEILDLSFNYSLTDDSMDSLPTSFCSGRVPHIKDLHFDHTRFGKYGGIRLAEAIKNGHLPSLEKLSFNSCKLEGQASKILAASFKSGQATQLQELAWQRVGVRARGVTELAKAIRSGKLGALRKLNLSFNPDISDKSARCLADALGSGQAKNLTDLDLRFCDLGDECRAELVETIDSDNLPSLERVELYNFYAIENRQLFQGRKATRLIAVIDVDLTKMWQPLSETHPKFMDGLVEDGRQELDLLSRFGDKSQSVGPLIWHSVKTHQDTVRGGQQDPEDTLEGRWKWDRVKSEQIKLEQVKLEQMELEQEKPEQMELEQVEPEQMEPEQMELEQVKPNQVKPEQVKMKELPKDCFSAKDKGWKDLHEEDRGRDFPEKLESKGLFDDEEEWIDFSRKGVTCEESFDFASKGEGVKFLLEEKQGREDLYADAVRWKDLHTCSEGLLPLEKKGHPLNTSWKEEGTTWRMEYLERELHSSQQVTTQAGSSSAPGQVLRESFVDHLFCNDEIEFAPGRFDGTGSNSNTNGMEPMKQDQYHGAGNGKFQFRSDVQSLGFTSWDQEFSPDKVLLLCDLNLLEQEVHILFFHEKAMANLFGVGVASSKVSITLSLQSGYGIQIKEMGEESWKSCWVSCEGVWKAILCQQTDVVSMVTKENVHCFPRDEALSRFGISVGGLKDQLFVNLSSSASEDCEDATKFQPKWIRWCAELVQHIQSKQECNNRSGNHNDNLQMLDKRLWHYAYGTLGEDCHSSEDGNIECGSHDSHDSNDQLHYKQQDGHPDESFHSATQQFDSNHIKIPCKADLTHNQSGAGSSGGKECHRTGGEQNVQKSKDGCEQSDWKRRKCSPEGDNSIDKKVASRSDVKARTRECKKSLIINVLFCPRKCDLYRCDSITGIMEQTATASGMPKSSIKPTLIIEFLYDPKHPGGINKVNTTLEAEYQFDNQSCHENGWYQDRYGMSFRHSKAEHSDAQTSCDVRSHRIVSDVVYEEWEITTQSGSENCDLKETNRNGSLQSGSRWPISFEGTISNAWRRETTMKENGTNQLMSKVKTCRLADNPGVAIKSACKFGTLEYTAHSVHEPVMPDDPSWRQMEATGLYSNVEMAVTGTWFLFGDEKESYEFTEKKALSKHKNLRGASATSGRAGVRGDVIATGNSGTLDRGNAVGEGDETERPLWQIFTREIILNHNFSEFFESLKRAKPYEWVLRELINSGNPIPQAMEVSVSGPVGGSARANQASAPVDGTSGATPDPAPAPDPIPTPAPAPAPTSAPVDGTSGATPDPAPAPDPISTPAPAPAPTSAPASAPAPAPVGSLPVNATAPPTPVSSPLVRGLPPVNQVPAPVSGSLPANQSPGHVAMGGLWQKMMSYRGRLP